jgi:signal peptidase I
MTASVNPAQPKPHETHDATRDWLETIVFVSFLVLLLKTYVAEAFVIPTGSMAPTRLGEHHEVTCHACGYPYTHGVQGAGNGAPAGPSDPICPNCHHRQKVSNPAGGDKVLVLKPRFDYARPNPASDRHSTFVFKYPGNSRTDDQGNPVHDQGSGLGPQKGFAAYNFIKRLWGFPGESITIWNGDVYLRENPKANGDQNGDDSKQELSILRKRPDTMMAMRQLVYDADYPAAAFIQANIARWMDEAQRSGKGKGGWTVTADREFAVVAGADLNWLRYEHRVPLAWELDRADPNELRKSTHPPHLIGAFVGYNDLERNRHTTWVSDLMVDFQLEIQELTGELIVELIAGVDRYRAVLDLANNKVRLEAYRQGEVLPLKTTEAPARITSKGTYRIRFADWDQRLTVWIDQHLPFEEGVEVPPIPAEMSGPTLADLGPAALGARNAAVRVTHLGLYRDIYYSPPAIGNYTFEPTAEEIEAAVKHGLALANRQEVSNDNSLSAELRSLHLGIPERKVKGGDPQKWYRPIPPEHHKQLAADEYFALGDNSAASLDSREWGSVPERMILGKAVVVYWPWYRWGLIR